MIRYQKGFKFWIKEGDDKFIQTDIKGYYIVTKVVVLRANGWLHIKKHFGSDGGTGVKTTKKNSRGFFTHDALFYLMKTRELPCTKENIKQAGVEMQKVHIEDGVWKWLARIYNFGGTKFGGKYANPKNAPKIYKTK